MIQNQEVRLMLTPEGYKSRLVEKQFDEYMQTFWSSLY